jgi:hypothetical protein
MHPAKINVRIIKLTGGYPPVFYLTDKYKIQISNS